MTAELKFSYFVNNDLFLYGSKFTELERMAKNDITLFRNKVPSSVLFHHQADFDAIIDTNQTIE